MKYVLGLLLNCLHSFTFSQDVCLPFAIGNGLTFLSRDSVLVSRSTSKVDHFGKMIYQIFLHTNVDGEWSIPTTVPFSKGDFTDYHPEAYGDSIVFFISRRPEPNQNQGINYGNLWFVKLNKGKWSEPVFISELNQKGHDTYPSFTKSGNLYFNSDRPGGKGSMDIYVSKYKNGTFTPPVPVASLNSSQSENDLVVDPLESYIIFNRYNFTTKELDLYISFKENNSWSNPVELQVLNRHGVFELTPTLSLDGSVFYYEVNGQILCIETDRIISTLGRNK